MAVVDRVEFGPGKLEEALAGQDVGFVPFVELIGYRPQSLEEYMARLGIRPATKLPFSDLTIAALGKLFNYSGDPEKRAGVPTLVHLAFGGEQSLGALAGSSMQTVEYTDRELGALAADGFVQQSIDDFGLRRFSLTEDYTG